MEHLRGVILVCLGGAAGSGLRYAVGAAMSRSEAGRFPWGTLTVNIVGSFLLVLLMANHDPLSIASERVRLALGVGLLGGFTTYSSFNLEMIELARSGHTGLAGAYLLATVIGALLAGLAAISLIR